MEKKLKELFDYQKFENDVELNCMIDSVLCDGVELSDEDLSMVSAAGELEDKKRQAKEIAQAEKFGKKD